MNQTHWTRWLGRLVVCGFAASSVLAACAEDPTAAEPSCGDGKVNGDEPCDGDKFVVGCIESGFEAGEATCTDSCELDTTACVILDEDQDLLNIYDEQAIGTDPLNPDTDGDGILDGTEVQNASDPLNMNSWPAAIGAWPNRIAFAIQDMVMPNGWTTGAIPYDRIWTDQYGQQVNLHQFYGYVVVLSLGARWCGPCQQAASSAQELFDQYRDQGVVFLEQLTDGLTPGVNANEQDVQLWTQQFGLQFPVMYSDQPLLSPAVPTYYILDRHLRITQKYEGFPGDPTLGGSIQAALNVP